MFIFILLLLILFLVSTRKSVKMTTIDSDPGFHTLNCLSENEVMSCTFTGMADITKNGEGAPEWLQKLYKTLAYGGENKYSLKDVDGTDTLLKI